MTCFTTEVSEDKMSPERVAAYKFSILRIKLINDEILQL